MLERFKMRSLELDIEFCLVYVLRIDVGSLLLRDLFGYF